VVDAPSLETFKAKLDGALSSVIELKMSLLTAGAWNTRPLKVPSNPNHSMILYIHVYIIHIYMYSISHILYMYINISLNKSVVR